MTFAYGTNGVVAKIHQFMKLPSRKQEEEVMRPVFVLSIVGFFVFAMAAAAQEETGYLVGPGDTLYVMVWGHEELSGTIPVAPDGTILLPSPVGVVEVRGMTVKEIEELLTTQLSRYVKSPQVTVSLREIGFLIHIIGEVRAPSFYKVPEETTLQELITRAGGLTQYADTEHVKITSQNSDGMAITQEVDFSRFLIGNEVSANPVLKPNDVVFVPRITTAEYLGKIVSVLGSVTSPGTFELDEEMTLLDVIALSGGSTTDADLEKIQVVSLSPYSIQTANLKRYMTEHDPSGNPTVRARMVVYVPSTYVPTKLTIPVNVVGQVLKPGAYEVLAETSKLTDVIFKAGGFAESADIGRVKIIRGNPKVDEKNEFNVRAFLVADDILQNPIIREGDIIVVPLSKTAKQISVVDSAFVSYKTVDTIGEVRKAGTYQVPVGASLLDVLILAGGVTPGADLERTTVIREAGKGTKFEINLKKVLTEGRFDLLLELESGDKVFIPQKKESRWGQIVRFAGQASTVAVLVLILTGRKY